MMCSTNGDTLYYIHGVMRSVLLLLLLLLLIGVVVVVVVVVYTYVYTHCQCIFSSHCSGDVLKSTDSETFTHESFKSTAVCHKGCVQWVELSTLSLEPA